MKTSAVRLHGKNDLRLETFELPPMQDDESLAKVVSDGLCMSSYKAAIQGEEHKRIFDDLKERPIIIGHELSGEIVRVGKKWQHEFTPGDHFAIQPAFNYKGSLAAPGYSYPYLGGDATYVLLPQEAMETGCVLLHHAKAHYFASLAEPMSCIIRAFRSFYHIVQGDYSHNMGIAEGGKMAILGGGGPMGMGSIDYALNCERRPSVLVVTDVDPVRIKRLKEIYTEDFAAERGVELHIANTGGDDALEQLMALSGGTGYDDVMVMAPIRALVEQGDQVLGYDGCLNFFAGPTTREFAGEVNFYNVHYGSTRIIGSSGGNKDDLKEALDMMSKGQLNPSAMITHIGGLDCVAETTLQLPVIPGGKKLIYTHKKMPLTAISDFAELGKTDPLFRELSRIVEANRGFWCPAAEAFLLENWPSIEA